MTAWPPTSERYPRLPCRDATRQSKAEPLDAEWRSIGTGQWEHIGTGAGFPAGKLQQKIEEYLRAGHRVFLDIDPRWWQPCSWQAAEIHELVSIEPHFHFKKVAPTVYEIQPVEDASATDQPHLARLLPANRVEEVKKCFSAG